MREEKLSVLKEQINVIIKEAEALGEKGEIEEAQTTLESCEKLKAECKYFIKFMRFKAVIGNKISNKFIEIFECIFLNAVGSI
jgi:hypothetical protein